MSIEETSSDSSAPEYLDTIIALSALVYTHFIASDPCFISLVRADSVATLRLSSSLKPILLSMSHVGGGRSSKVRIVRSLN